MTDSDKFNRQRRSLLIVSIALITYFLADGKFDGDIGLRTFGISLQREGVAITFIWLAFFYFWYRFYLFGRNEQSEWKLDFIYEISKTKEFLILIEQPTAKPDGKALSTIWVPTLTRRGTTITASWASMTEGAGAIDRQRFYNSSRSPHKNWSVDSTSNQELSVFKFISPATKAYFGTFRHAGGTDWVLPLFLAWVALISGVLDISALFIQCFIDESLFCTSLNVPFNNG